MRKEDIAISAKALTKQYKVRNGKPVTALSGASMLIPHGVLCAIEGPSGCGKTTLLNAIGCLDRPDSGELLIAGTDVVNASEKARAELRNRNIGYVFQEFRLIDTLNVYDNVRLPLLISRDTALRDIKERVRQCLSIAGLPGYETRLASKLSGGQRQRVAIARALAMQPGIVLADEPTGSLDSKARAEIMDVFASIRDAGNTVVLVTHDAQVAGRCELRLSMRDGVIL